MIEDFFATLFFTLQRWWFVGDTRRSFYLELAMLIRNGTAQKTALEKLYSIYSYDGKKPRRIKGVVAKECLDGLAEPRTVPETLYDWVPFDEFQLISAGRKGEGGTERALVRAADLVRRKNAMRSTLIKKLSYPGVQAIALVALLYYIAKKALPQILKMSKPETWDWSAYLMSLFAHIVGDYAVMIGALMVVGIAFTIWSIPNLTGPLRIRLERLPPWSIVCRIWGSTFLFNYALLQNAGQMGPVILKDALQMANPYVAERMHGALIGVKSGKNIGESLHLAGFNFPSREGVEFARTIAGQEGGADAMMQFTGEWLDKTVEDVGALADVVASLITMLNIATIVFVLAGSGSIGTAALMH